MNKKLIIISGSILILAALGGGAIYYASNDKDSDGDTANTIQEDQDINLEPATEADKKNTQEHKESLPDANSAKNESSNQQTDQKKTVTPQITSSGEYQGNIEVSARVPGIFEESGQCTLTMEKSGKKVTASRPATPNVSEMSCGLMKIPKKKLSSGQWNTTVTYSSSQAKGTSKPIKITVN